jgi:tetratricopeptide (TPR) repeat protein
MDLAGAREAMRTGDYAAVLKAAEARGDAKEEREGWSLVHAEALTVVSRYTEALAVLDRAMSHDVQSIRVRWAARELGQALGDQDRVRALSQEIAELVSRRRWAYRDPVNLVVFGRLALALGADPKDVLDRVFAVAQKAAPTLRDVYLARGELALEKHDFALAAKAFTEGSEKVPDDPDLLFGAARAFESGNRAAMLAALTAALKVNPRHVPSLLAQVDHLIDAEAYPDAGKKLDEIAAISPAHPELFAYRAVIAHLAGQPEEAAVARLRGLRVAETNPRVDHVIGRKLSQKYRFSEGAAAQREALKLDPDFLPAKAQLASDLLRLGKEDEGWALIAEVNEKDGYDVEAYNLVTLRDTLSKYAVLKNEAFSIRMTQREADLYGPRVLALLTRARDRLVSRYGVELAEPTIVDIFADQKDFAVRTFGLPDIQGFLGVCFGRVVTANSPAATGVAKGVNWESVLWHEYCHVVTLQFTRNKMPRWLSEGISVYEERQADPAWGMRLTPPLLGDAAKRGPRADRGAQFRLPFAADAGARAVCIFSLLPRRGVSDRTFWL